MQWLPREKSHIYIFFPPDSSYASHGNKKTPLLSSRGIFDRKMESMLKKKPKRKDVGNLTEVVRKLGVRLPGCVSAAGVSGLSPQDPAPWSSAMLRDKAAAPGAAFPPVGAHTARAKDTRESAGGPKRSAGAAGRRDVFSTVYWEKCRSGAAAEVPAG